MDNLVGELGDKCCELETELNKLKEKPVLKVPAHIAQPLLEKVLEFYKKFPDMKEEDIRPMVDAAIKAGGRTYAWSISPDSPLVMTWDFGDA